MRVRRRAAVIVFQQLVDKRVRPDEYGDEKRTVDRGAKGVHRVRIVCQSQHKRDDVERNQE